MKKWLALLGLAACLMMFSAVPAFADNMARTDNTPGDEIRHEVNKGINTTNRALGTDIHRINNGNTVSANNYRANATDDNDFDWGWLGLLGLIGLAGMRNRGRDRA
ncbi:WGxxGxxG-CTERM domain-containing protein [Paenibacillus glycanilyticus]|uniref:WGxxGxxG family protein n=1 Tax=Paenibacillus glycanilyticus TaxID=126569 RepID=UPI0020403528|nr:WGxxGxxG family protein [Paenibacillus glycanilyticus]MCM3626174.1 WGxxGxxG-CTERM domain-containing protein [Paenibacillus glycanilyticus]